MSAIERRIGEIVEPAIAGLGYELVRVKLYGGGRNPTLQIMVEPQGGGTMTVDGCAEVSRTVSAVLDVEDPIEGTYELEVSSPGIDRPLTRPEDFRRFAGFEARVELKRAGEDGRRRYRGRITGLDDEGNVLLYTGEDETVALPFAEIGRAKLILTDDLIAASAAGS